MDIWLESSRTAGEADTIGEQQLKRTPSGSRVEHSGSSSRSERNREAVETDASGEQQLKRMQAGAQQQLKRIDAIAQGAAAEADAIGRGTAALHRGLSGTGLLRHVGERGGSS